MAQAGIYTATLVLQAAGGFLEKDPAWDTISVSVATA